MLDVFQAERYLELAVSLALIVVCVLAFVIALTYSAEAYNAAGKWTKQGWVILLGIGALLKVLMIGVPFLISLVFVIAALVFFADVRPALSGLYRR